MTATLETVDLWHVRPGWGIAADLTPPELINFRQLKVLRKVIAGGLVALLALCSGAYVIAAHDHSTATRAFDQQQAGTAKLQSSAAKYGGITRMQGTVAAVQGQIAQLMSSDVDLVALMNRISGGLPERMTITQESITISVAGAAGATGGTPAVQSIGTVTLTGAGRTLNDLATFVDKLEVIPGLVNVVPNSNSVSEAGMRYNVTLGLTRALLSHRYDVSTKGTR